MCFYLSLLKRSPLVIHVTLLHFLHYHFTYVVHHLSDEKVTPKKKYPMEMLIYTLIGTMYMAIILLSLAFKKKFGCQELFDFIF